MACSSGNPPVNEPVCWYCEREKRWFRLFRKVPTFYGFGPMPICRRCRKWMRRRSS